MLTLLQIRDMIWELALKSDIPIEPSQIKKRSNQFKGIGHSTTTKTLTSILMTCRLFHKDQEARPTFYEVSALSNNFFPPCVRCSLLDSSYDEHSVCTRTYALKCAKKTNRIR